VSFSELKRTLKAAGWRQTNEPPRRPEQAVVATLKDNGQRDRLLKKAVIRYSYVVLLPPAEIPAGKVVRVVVGHRYPDDETSRRYELADGEDLDLSVSRRPARLTHSDDQAYNTTVYRFAVEKDRGDRKLVTLQGVVELVEDGRVTDRWYTRIIADVQFEKEPAEKPER
jgi:hypothetical protein